MKRPTSDIPAEAAEVEVQAYHQKGAALYFQVKECILNGQVVGLRSYDDQGNLMRETSMRDGKRHGREYIWNEMGNLESVEPYCNGKIHGLAKQYGRNGNVIGTYRLLHGTGYDIWRCENQDGSIDISEIFTLKDNALHGYEWWLNADQRSVWHERHWQHGQYHGIERVWNQKGGLKRGYPKYWINGQAVNKGVYLKTAERDKTLPEFREKENRPQRKFPPEIESLLLK